MHNPTLKKWIRTSTLPAPIIVSFIVILLFYFFKKRSSNMIKTKKAPEVVGAWPVIGHLNLLSVPKPAYIVLGELADQYGPAFSIQFGMHPILVVSSWELVKACFTTNDKFFSSRLVNKAIKYMFYDQKTISFAPHGPYWRELRKMITLNLLSNERLKMLKHQRISEMDACLKKLYELSTKRKDENAGVLVDMSKWFGDISFNVVTRIVAGKHIFGPKTERYKNVMEEARCLMDVMVFSDVMPYLGWLDRLRGVDSEIKRTAKELDSVLESWVDEHRQKRVSIAAGIGRIVNITEEEEIDFIDIMLSIIAKNKLPGDDPGTLIKAIVQEMYLAAWDNTTVTLTWALCLLLNNKQVLKRAQCELDAQVGKERQVEDSDINTLPYIQAIVKESMRLYPPGPIIERETTEDCDVGGFRIPAGTRLWINLWKLQRDPNVWPNDPQEFQPERFLNGHADIDMKGQHFELIPFGSGRRMCPGVSFSLQVMHLVLARIIHGFELKTPTDADIDMSTTLGMISWKATPLEVLLTPRFPSVFYM
ncbi:hypothetical protein IFM89_012607 [Coptis chinensis]|uniref:Cytochrome P450 n=1 Tax=Coptis chinensis TaxID=261450 RepID=A0A835IMA2_9MAGN|nr:hypothetical protein IFM89_012607 [Coptis chinensis]